MPDFKFNEAHFCWTVIISITWSQTQTNYRNPACDSPTPSDAAVERDTWSEFWAEFWENFLAEMLPGCSDPAFRSRVPASETHCRNWKLWEVVFWILAWDKSLRGFLGSTVHALQNPFRILTLWTWEFSAVWGHWVAVTIKRKNCWQIQVFLMLHPLLSSWLPPSPTHLQHSSFIPLLGTPRKPCWNFTCSHSRKDTCEQWSPSSWEHHPAGAFSCLFGSWASPLSFPACCRQNHPWTTRFNSCPTVQGGLQHLLVLQVCHQHPNTAVKYAKSITDCP